MGRPSSYKPDWLCVSKRDALEPQFVSDSAGNLAELHNV